MPLVTAMTPVLCTAAPIIVCDTIAQLYKKSSGNIISVFNFLRKNIFKTTIQPLQTTVVFFLAQDTAFFLQSF